METTNNSAAQKLQEVITAKTMESLQATPKKETKKASSPKAKKTQIPKDPEKQVIKEVKKQNKANLVEEVISNREVKYIYPVDCQDTLSRKKWRQKVRNEIKRLKLVMADIADKTSKEYLKAEKAYNAYYKKHVKAGA